MKFSLGAKNPLSISNTIIKKLFLKVRYIRVHTYSSHMHEVNV